MTITTTNDSHPHYSHPLVTWGPTLLGAITAIVTGITLNLLGAALGFATTAIGQSSEAAAAAGIGGLVWFIAANATAIAFGAWIAARSSASPDHHRGTLQGIAVWALVSALTLAVAGTTLFNTAGNAMQSLGMASGVTVAQKASQGNPSQTAQNVQNTASNVASDVQNSAQATFNDDTAQGRQNIQDVATSSAVAAMGGFIAMLVGFCAAILGARIGAKHPQWHNRSAYNYNTAYNNAQSYNPNSPSNPNSPTQFRKDAA